MTIDERISLPQGYLYPVAKFECVLFSSFIGLCLSICIATVWQ